MAEISDDGRPRTWSPLSLNLLLPFTTIPLNGTGRPWESPRLGAPSATPTLHFRTWPVSTYRPTRPCHRPSAPSRPGKATQRDLASFDVCAIAHFTSHVSHSSSTLQHTTWRCLEQISSMCVNLRLTERTTNFPSRLRPSSRSARRWRPASLVRLAVHARLQLTRSRCAPWLHRPDHSRASTWRLSARSKQLAHRAAPKRAERQCRG